MSTVFALSRLPFCNVQVISSANFRTGGDNNDFMHGWLNYQVEHHMWPQLSALSYQKAQPEVAAICAKYGVPYVQVLRCLPLAGAHVVLCVFFWYLEVVVVVIMMTGESLA